MFESYQNVIHRHQESKGHAYERVKDYDEHPRVLTSNWAKAYEYEFGSHYGTGTNVRELDHPGEVDSTVCYRCPECGWGIDLGDGEDVPVRCRHCGSDSPAEIR